MTLFRQNRTAQSGSGQSAPLGIIDIGSNSVRLVVYNNEPGALTPLFNEKVLCGLGRSVATQGHLGEEAVSRALKALTRFRSIADRFGVKDLSAIATAAVREAKDGSLFVERAQKCCGVDIDVLTGEREAVLAAKGLKMGVRRPNGIVGDLGGGSLELIDVKKDQFWGAVTLPLGGLRLIDAAKGDLEHAKSLIEKEFDRIDWLSKGKGRDFYAVGGTLRALAKLHMSATNYPLYLAQGYSISSSEARAFARTVYKSKRLSDFSGLDDISKARREVLPFGAMVLECLLARLKPTNVVFSVYGVREGLLYDMLPTTNRDEDPLLAYCEHIASINSRSVKQAHEMCRWTDQVFQAEGPVPEKDVERRLRHAACLLSDIGWRGHPDYREDQVPGQVAFSVMSGIDHPGRMFLALALHHRHAGIGATGRLDMWAGFRTVLGRSDERRARLVAAAMRCAHALSAGLPGVIDDTHVRYEDGKIILEIADKHADLDGERLRRRFSALASLIGVQPEVRIC